MQIHSSMGTAEPVVRPVPRHGQKQQHTNCNVG